MDDEHKDLADAFLDPKNIFAVVGVSRDHDKYGYKVYLDLKLGGYKVFPVNPNIESIEGERCYHSLADLPVIPDVLSIVVPPSVTEKIIKEAAGLGIKKIWMQPGSESETALDYCKAEGIMVLHDACIMIKRKDSKKMQR